MARRRSEKCGGAVSEVPMVGGAPSLHCGGLKSNRNVWVASVPGTQWTRGKNASIEVEFVGDFDKCGTFLRNEPAE